VIRGSLFDEVRQTFDTWAVQTVRLYHNAPDPTVWFFSTRISIPFNLTKQTKNKKNSIIVINNNDNNKNN
jgi:hypothetical protein